MTYLLIVLGVLREIASREPRCFAAVAAGMLALGLMTRTRLAVAAHGLTRRGAVAPTDRRVTVPVR